MFRILIFTFLLSSCVSDSSKESSKSTSSPSKVLVDGIDAETPVGLSFNKMNTEGYDTSEWVAPDYSNQMGKIGYDPEVSFTASGRLRIHVDFWKRIYSEFSSWQGLLHDSVHIDLVYEEVDFSEIMLDSQTTYAQKLKLRRQLVDRLKKKVQLSVANIRARKPLSPYEAELKLKIERYSEKGILSKLPKKGRLRFQLGQKDYIQNGIFHSGAYLKEIERIFEEKNLPKELTRLPFVESSFNLKARSKVGASGIWQIMPGTARGKLSRSYFYDYRNHPIEAAKLAADILRYNHKVLKKWPLALTAYNYGPAGIRRLVKKVGTSDINELIKMRKRRWGFASSNFYASFLAILEVEKDAKTHFGEEIIVRSPIPFERVKTKTSISGAEFKKIMDQSTDFKKLNPQFNLSRLDSYSYLKRGLPIYFSSKTQASKLAFNELGSFTPKYDKKSHKVRRGQTLSQIARRYGVSVRSIVQMNNLKSANQIKIGQNLKVPIRRR
ncbi:MAG: transglycosylase SLT domain-containing protein [Bdellovibrionales bacterium]